MYIKSLYIPAIFFTIIFNQTAFAQQVGGNLSYVDPTIGGVGLILEPTRPTAHLPNSMLRVYPMKKDQLDDRIAYFPLNIPSHRTAKVFSFLPLSGNDPSKLWDLKLTIAKEKLHPYYYQVIEEDEGNIIEFSPSERSGYFKVTYNTPAQKYLRIGNLNKEGDLQVEGKRVITGTETFSGMKAYFYAEVDADIIQTTTKKGAKNAAILVEINPSTKVLSFKYGISYISIAQAKINLQKEITAFDFEKLKQLAINRWTKTLSQVNVSGGTPSQKRVFYTSLYRTYERMVDINEYGKYYSAFDRQVHESNEPFYVDNWIWDNYIALEPLHTILNPEKEVQKIRSYIKMYEQGGSMPSFGVTFGDWPAMTGNHAASWIADAWSKGLRNFDLKKAYEGLKKNSLESTLIPWRNGPLTALDSFYNEKGFMPGLAPGQKETIKEVEPTWEKRQAVSVTLENSLSDWAIAQLAAASGNAQDRPLFLKRAANYKNVFRVDKGIVWPKDINGNWIEPYNPKLAGREYFTENNAYTYNWHVKHDLTGLFKLMGGTKSAEDKLDQLFREDLSLPKWKFWATQPDASGLVGQFVMGNEPSFHIPYLYNYMGAPWKTQKRIRMLLDTWFTDSLFGIPGDEDGGGMTSFVVFSMMGFFPVTPGIPIYTIGSPTFNEISIQLPNGKTFMVHALNNAADHQFIQSAKLNGKVLERAWFTHQELMAGGILELTMGETPNKLWGSQPATFPPSSIDYLTENNFN